jgi:trehalose 6-phosphate synthase
MEYDVLLVNPVMDGLNLVAKEAPLVNARDGALVLSREAGAYEELGEWVVGIDPLDVDGQAEALRRAIALAPADRRARLDGIRSTVRTHDVEAWAARELAELDERAPRRTR